METKNIICVTCPRGCPIAVTLEDGIVTAVSGNACKRGHEYAINEVTAPVRMLTRTVRVKGGVIPMLPVKTAAPIPKDLLLKAMRDINAVIAQAPVCVGDVVLANVMGTGVDIVAARDVAKA